MWRLGAIVLCFGGTASAADFRDLNKNGRLDVYEDEMQSVERRIEDLLSQMTVAEKAGLMFINRANDYLDASIDYRPEGGPLRRDPVDAIDKNHLNHFNVGEISDPLVFAAWQNNLQRHAEHETRLGIPITMASDPRHHFSSNIYAFESGTFSQFPETLGFAAIGDADLVERFTLIVRKEYVAIGLRLALHPQVDLATEPRWSRINGGFGEDAALSARMAKAYVRGLQGRALGADSVAAMTKHFPGGGPQNEGLDPHFAFQKGQVYPGHNFDYHLIPFEAAMEAGTSAMMLYYGVPVGQTSEEVAMAFNKDIVTGLLREKYAYDGIICADWGVITDITIGDGVLWPARAWGVEELSRRDRVKKALVAGLDQFGGERAADLVVELVDAGEITEGRIDESARRILKQKFELGLFDNPYVDVEKAVDQIGTPADVMLGHEAQRRSLTLLKNQDQVLPLAKNGLSVFVAGIDSSAVNPFAAIADSPQNADFAILRIATPWYPAETDNPFALTFHHGNLDFTVEQKAVILDLLEAVPTVVVIYLDRPAVIPEIVNRAAAVIADFGASDRAVAEVLFGDAGPEGKLPFELPSSMDAVRHQLPDMPSDSADPLFPIGFGLRYE